jgi:hypothetical protein
MSAPEALFPMFVYHCCFGCGHTERDTDTFAAADRMEDHYGQEHQERIDQIIGGVR